jgi:hypothetical protein
LGHFFSHGKIRALYFDKKCLGISLGDLFLPTQLVTLCDTAAVTRSARLCIFIPKLPILFYLEKPLNDEIGILWKFCNFWSFGTLYVLHFGIF